MPDPNPLEENLSKIEIGIRQLKIQYDMFFSGVLPRQPYEVRKELEILIKQVGNTPMQRFADRFRYNSLASKYQTMAELWAKMLRAKEEGRLRPGIPGFVEPVRNPAAAAGAGEENAKPGEVYRHTFSDPSAEAESVRLFYDRFIEARRVAGDEAASRITYGSFLKQITAKTQAIKEKVGCDTVTYSIVLKEGAVGLKAIPAGQTRRKGERK